MKHVEQTGRLSTTSPRFGWDACKANQAIDSLGFVVAKMPGTPFPCGKKNESHSHLAWLLFHVQVLTYMSAVCKANGRESLPQKQPYKIQYRLCLYFRYLFFFSSLPSSNLIVRILSFTPYIFIYTYMFGIYLSMVFQHGSIAILNPPLWISG